MVGRLNLGPPIFQIIDFLDSLFIMTDDNFKPCAPDCVCAEYPDLRGDCDEIQPESCSTDCTPVDCECVDQLLLQTFARSVDRLSASVLLLGQMIDETMMGSTD